MTPILASLLILQVQHTLPWHSRILPAIAKYECEKCPDSYLLQRWRERFEKLRNEIEEKQHGKAK